MNATEHDRFIHQICWVPLARNNSVYLIERELVRTLGPAINLAVRYGPPIASSLWSLVRGKFFGYLRNSEGCGTPSHCCSRRSHTPAMKEFNLPLLQLFIGLYGACSGALGADQVPSTIDIKLKTGTFRGLSTPNGTEKWLGVPFALPPVGNLRFKAPVPVTKASSAIMNASAFGNACPQPADGGLGAPVAEDCLFLNIWRPQGLKEGSKLPVLFWIHGGAYTSGASSAPSTDPTGILQRSVEVGKPIIFVSTNYRLNTFGFLASADVASKDLNAGLLDQRMALSFVQENIAAFGGDPAKVTIWGQSAGAGSVESLFLYPPKQHLFRAGIADSSTGPFKSSPDASTYDKPGKPFSSLLSATGCTPGRKSVSCLQQVPFNTLMNISNQMISSVLNSQLWQPAVGPHDSLIPVQASEKVKSGDFLHAPYLAGTNINEGATFSLSVRNLSLSGDAETATFDNFIGHLLIDNSSVTTDVLDTFHSLYPANNRSLGAPFSTGDSLFDRAEAWYTDVMFLAPRRLFFQHGSHVQTMFAYYFGEFIPGNDISLGVAHASELELLFGPIPPVAAVETAFSTQMRDFYINFINDLNPGAQWPAYKNGANNKNVLQLIRDNITLIQDDWNLEKTEFINTAKVLNEFEK